MNAKIKTEMVPVTDEQELFVILLFQDTLYVPMLHVEDGVEYAWKWQIERWRKGGRRTPAVEALSFYYTEAGDPKFYPGMEMEAPCPAAE